MIQPIRIDRREGRTVETCDRPTSQPRKQGLDFGTQPFDCRAFPLMQASGQIKALANIGKSLLRPKRDGERVIA